MGILTLIITDLEGETQEFTLDMVGTAYPADDVIYIDGNPCRLSTARLKPFTPLTDDDICKAIGLCSPEAFKECDNKCEGFNDSKRVVQYYLAENNVRVDDLRSQIVDIIKEYVVVTDEWGGSKLAEWKYGANVCIGSVDEAADEIYILIREKYGR
jgi:hypothetical protein